MRRFNLIEEKWIPVRFPDGTRDELGIRDTLLRSREIAAIEDPSPLVVAALHRFLLAVLYRALEGPMDIEQAKVLFRDGLPGEKITGYLEKWRNRFWLFDEKYPFYQVPGYEPKEEKGKKKWRPWIAMAAEHNADNAKVLFDHIEITGAGLIPSSKAVRFLIACQTFALGGGNSDFNYTKSGPSATSVMIVPLGMTLLDTLVFSLIPENREVLQVDIPVWEREPDSITLLQQGAERAINGLADLYSWRTRSIRFNLHADGLTVGELLFASGVACSSQNHVDPMFAYRIDDKRGKLPIQFRDRGLWRDFDSLLPDESHLAPQVIEHATTLTRSERERFPRSVIVLGQSNNKAKIEYWRMECFALPEALAGERFIRTEIKQLLEDAEDVQKSLWMACRSFARDLLSRGDRKPTGKDISSFMEQMPANSWYWSTLESNFHDILREYTLDRDSDAIRYQWLKAVRDTLKSAWRQHSASVSTGDAWAIRALVKAEGPVLRKLKELNDEIKKLET
ncbi:MAG: type I-E CRISPR-associated protein Cse1/CasA [Proteobacteria bacterium]|nr:type I-E CRISPR-associated protein Cse1/CasA [Pseudomonadota bacterium]